LAYNNEIKNNLDKIVSEGAKELTKILVASRQMGGNCLKEGSNPWITQLKRSVKRLDAGKDLA